MKPLTRKELPNAIRTAELRTTLICTDEIVRELGELAAYRMNRSDLVFVVAVRHGVFRNDRLYDRMNPETHAIVQIVRSMAKDQPGNKFSVKDENGITYYIVEYTK